MSFYINVKFYGLFFCGNTAYLNCRYITTITLNSLHFAVPYKEKSRNLCLFNVQPSIQRTTTTNKQKRIKFFKVIDLLRVDVDVHTLP